MIPKGYLPSPPGSGGKTLAVEYDGEDLLVAVEQGIEVR